MISIYLQPDMGIGLFLIPVFIPAYIFGILFTLVSLVLTQSNDRNRISHEGHLGGLLIGGLIGTYLFWPLEYSEHQLLTTLGVIPMILMLFVHNKIGGLLKK
jgi:membrane associated rhomboid family serine protease